MIRLARFLRRIANRLDPPPQLIIGTGLHRDHYHFGRYPDNATSTASGKVNITWLRR